MKLTYAMAVIQTLAEKRNLDFDGAMQYIQENFQDCHKFQRMAFETYAGYSNRIPTI